MRASRWAVLCCLLCLAACSSSSSSASTCSWQKLHEEEFTTQPHQITVRATEDGQGGNMTVRVVQKDDSKTSSSKVITIPSSSLHTLNLSCIDTSCGFQLRPDKRNQSKQYLVMSGFKKFKVKGDGNMEWSKGNCTETDDKTEGTNGNSQTSADDDDGPELWVLALIAAGVAVTVASISVFVWSLCGTCRSERDG